MYIYHVSVGLLELIIGILQLTNPKWYISSVCNLKMDNVGPEKEASAELATRLFGGW